MSEGQMGWIVTAKCPPQVSLQKLRDALVANGLEEDMAPDMLPKNALKRALDEMKDKKTINEKLRLDGDLVFFQVTKKYLSDEEITYSKFCEVGVDKFSGYVTGDDQAIVDVARKLLSEHLDKRLKRDLNTILHRIFDKRKADLVTISEAGGTYFVPDQFSDLVRSVEGFVRAIGGECNPLAVKLGCDKTSQSVANYMAQYMESSLDALENDCKELCADSSNRMIVNRLKAIQDKEHTLELYRTVMLGQASVVERRMAEVKKRILSKLTKDSEGNEKVAAVA